MTADTTTQFPFEAWDTVGAEIVEIVGFHRWANHYEDSRGWPISFKDITTVLPAWLIDAEQALEDEQDERDTQNDAIY